MLKIFMKTESIHHHVGLSSWRIKKKMRESLESFRVRVFIKENLFHVNWCYDQCPCYSSSAELKIQVNKQTVSQCTDYFQYNYTMPWKKGENNIVLFGISNVTFKSIKIQVLTPQIKPSSGAIVKMTYFAGINANTTLVTYIAYY